MNPERVWILGAPDPEMEAIENLLREAGERVAHASFRGRRVTPEHAYHADGILIPRVHLPPRQGRPPRAGCVTVECEPVFLRGAVILHIDHHRPQDPGYGVPPERFMEGSSAGQAVSALARFGARLPWQEVRASGPATPGEISFTREPGWAVTAQDGKTLAIPEDLVLAAAADHCLVAAYQGRCPGVDPDRLMRWRLASRARHQGRSVEDLLRDIERARSLLREAPGSSSGRAGWQTCEDLKSRSSRRPPPARASRSSPHPAYRKEHAEKSSSSAPLPRPSPRGRSGPRTTASGTSTGATHSGGSQGATWNRRPEATLPRHSPHQHRAARLSRPGP